MITHYLGDAEVDAYLRDLGQRLLDLPDTPNVWCPIGRSGVVLLRRLFRVVPKLEPKSDADGKVVIVLHNRNENTVALQATDPASDVGSMHVCVLDSSVHSGGTMLRAVRKVQELRPATLSTYSLVVKRSSIFFPTFWAVTIDDHDRMLFLLKTLPNNRMEAKKVPNCHLRALCIEDTNLEPCHGGLESIDKTTWADRIFDMKTSDHERRTYVLEVGSEVAGFLTISIRDGRPMERMLYIDEVVVKKSLQGTKHCSTMVRFAETVARQSRCHEIRLWAIENRIETYESIEFKKSVGTEVMDLGAEKYTLMHKKVLYHVNLPGAV